MCGCECVDFVICGCCCVWFLCVCMRGFCNMWVCVFVCGWVGILVICVLVFTVFCTFCTVLCIVSFMYIYSYLFCLYWCKDYCHRVTTQLKLVIITIITIIIIIIIIIKATIYFGHISPRETTSAPTGREFREIWGLFFFVYQNLSTRFQYG